MLLSQVAAYLFGAWTFIPVLLLATPVPVVQLHPRCAAVLVLSVHSLRGHEERACELGAATLLRPVADR